MADRSPASATASVHYILRMFLIILLEAMGTLETLYGPF